MLQQGSNRDFRYLDTDSDRKELIADIRRVRQAVVQMAEAVPQERHFEPRYHGWSLSALMMHLHLTDRLSLFGIQLALVGIHPPLSSANLDRLNDFTARVFQRRLLTATLRGMRAHESRITDFILRLPIDRFSKQVCYPPADTYLTVERAIQAFFLFHWQEHLQVMQKIEGIYYEPPSSAEV